MTLSQRTVRPAPLRKRGGTAARGSWAWTLYSVVIAPPLMLVALFKGMPEEGSDPYGL